MSKLGKEFVMTLRNLSPTLMHRIDMADLEGSITTKAGTGQRAKKISLDEDGQFEKALYKDDKGVYFPSKWFHMCLVNAGKAFAVKGKGKATYSKLMGSHIQIGPEKIRISNEKWEKDKQVVRNKATAGRTIACRPRFDKWECKVTVNIGDDSIDPGIIRDILSYGGQYVGVGAYRPEKKGSYGKFEVTNMKEVK